MSEKDLSNRELNDEELNKVAGGKNWDADDLKAGQAFLVCSTETYDEYYQIVSLSDTHVNGGTKSWELDDLEVGMVLYAGVHGDDMYYFLITGITNSEVKFIKYYINQNNKESYSSWQSSWSHETFIREMNNYGATESSFPSGFRTND